MKNVLPVFLCAIALSVPSLAVGQVNDQATTATTLANKAEAERSLAEVRAKMEQAQSAARFVRTLTNVQIELTITDQIGNGTPDKKIVSMVVSSGNWGKIRSAGNMLPPGEAPFVVDLNVDARPFVAVDGPIQLELTVAYAPAVSPATSQSLKGQPVKVSQSQTVVLQSGRSLIISQAADPVSDRKVIVEVKATVLK